MKFQTYRDSDGWLYKIRRCNGKYRIWYKKPCGSWLSFFLFPWRDTPEEAQADLDDHAYEEGWEKVDE